MASESITVIKIGEALLVAVPPDPDDETVTALQARVLEAMEKHEPSGLILDISLVEAMDSFLARTLAETTQMVSLMGGRTVIAGMRPGVAITTTQLGLTLGNATTALNVDRALLKLAEDHQ
jgi:rsbT antagonist protein RsbS